MKTETKVNIEAKSLAALSLTIKSCLIKHNISKDVVYPLIEDVLFQFANYIDNNTATNLHTSIKDELRLLQEEIIDGDSFDYLVASLRIAWEKGSKQETIILYEHMKHPKYLKEDIELTLGIRDLKERSMPIDAEKRFLKVKEKKGRIEYLEFQPYKDLYTNHWLKVPFKNEACEDVEQNIEEIISCICATCNEWVKKKH